MTAVPGFHPIVDGTIVNVALAQLATHLNAPMPSWGGLSTPTLSFAALMLGAGAITDTLGAKRAFVAGHLRTSPRTAHNLTTGFITCVIVASASSTVALPVTTLGAVVRRTPVAVTS